METITLKQKIIGVITLLVLDILWIKYYMGGKYQTLVLKIQNQKIVMNYYSAFVAYTLMVVALVCFVMKYQFTLLETFIFGICLYGVYDFTCGAVFKNWDFQLALIDVLWGGFVYTMAYHVALQF